jgi:hypothetical protein
MRTSIARLVAVFGLLLGTLAFGTAASAADTNPYGAQVVNVDQCYDFGGGVTACVAERAVITAVVTKSGYESVVMNGYECITLTDATGAVVAHQCVNVKDHALIQQDTTQEQRLVEHETLTINGQTDCFDVVYHYANGQFQYGSIAPVAC